MRLKASDDHAQHCTAYLDGEKLPHCIEADEAEGWALCAVVNEQGQPIFDSNGEDGVKVETRRGAVELRFDPPEWRERVALLQAQGQN